jgi:hypothetical protein
MTECAEGKMIQEMKSAALSPRETRNTTTRETLTQPTVPSLRAGARRSYCSMRERTSTGTASFAALVIAFGFCMTRRTLDRCVVDDANMVEDETKAKAIESGVTPVTTDPGTMFDGFHRDIDEGSTKVSKPNGETSSTVTATEAVSDPQHAI